MILFTLKINKKLFNKILWFWAKKIFEYKKYLNLDEHNSNQLKVLFNRLLLSIG